MESSVFFKKQQRIEQDDDTSFTDDRENCIPAKAVTAKPELVVEIIPTTTTSNSSSSSRSNTNSALVEIIDDERITITTTTNLSDDKKIEPVVIGNKDTENNTTKDVIKTTAATSAAAASEKRENPFACFAYQKIDDGDNNNNTRTAQSFIQPSKKSRFKKWAVTKSTTTTTVKHPNIKKKKKDSGTFACGKKMNDLSKEEQERIIKKWHSLVDSSATLEVKRFQVLVAARLHARCQEKCVKVAMDMLRDVAFHGDEFSVETVANSNPETLATFITNLQYYNTKAKQIVKAAQEIKTEFDGIVPEDETSLLRITGIGTVFADLLAFVNTRAAHGNDINFKEV